jgi:DNA-binding NarL/FixJ family response regulator
MRHALQAVGPFETSDPMLTHRDAGGKPPVRVLLAESRALVRAGLRVLLERQDDIRVVAEAATGEEAVAEARRVTPDVVLIDGALPGLDPIEVTRQIVEDGEPSAVRAVMMLGADQSDAVIGALDAGATGVLLKDTHPASLTEAIRAVARGDAFLVPSVATQVVAALLSRPQPLAAPPSRLAELTAREREVVSLVGCGLSNEEIAEHLVVTRATAKTHVSRALCKLGVRDRAQLVVLAYETGLVQPGPAAPEVREPSGVPTRPARTARRRELAGMAA